MLEKQTCKIRTPEQGRRYQEAKELNELKLNFFTNVSHELRTPLTLIISPLVNMIREEREESKRRKLEMIHRNATRLLNLVNQILDFRKIRPEQGETYAVAYRHRQLRGQYLYFVPYFGKQQGNACLRFYGP